MPGLDLTALDTIHEGAGPKGKKKSDGRPLTLTRDRNKGSSGDREKASHNPESIEHALFVKKKVPSFVFPSEKSVDQFGANNSGDSSLTRYTDPTTANLHHHQGMHLVPLSADSDHLYDDSNLTRGRGSNSDRTLSFSLSNPKLGKYLSVEDDMLTPV